MPARDDMTYTWEAQSCRVCSVVNDICSGVLSKQYAHTRLC